MLRGRLPADTFDRILARAPALRWVHSATAGVERVLTPASRDRGLTITNARGVFSRPIAEYVMLMILAVSRRLPQLLELQAERTWQPLEARELRDVTVGIVGLGSSGRAVGSPDRRPELRAESAFVVPAAPLTDDTRGLIGEAAIGQLKPGAWVINGARGGLVDGRALVRALREGRIGGAVLHTFREEPLPA